MEYIGKLANWEVETSNVRVEENGIYVIMSRELGKTNRYKRKKSHG